MSNNTPTRRRYFYTRDHETGGRRRVYLPKHWHGNEYAEELHNAICDSGGYLHTSIKSVSRSGMSRVIAVYAAGYSEDCPMRSVCYLAEQIGVARLNKSWSAYGLRIGGCGMDMTAHVVMRISHELYGDHYAVSRGQNI